MRYGLDARSWDDQGLIHMRMEQDNLCALAATATYMICFGDLSICCMLYVVMWVGDYDAE